jgi:predicted extracellular nuclease
MPTTFQPGDVAIVGFSADTTAAAGGAPKSLSFVVLTDVEAGTTLTFTDNGWLAAGGFRANEGVTTYTFSAATSAGAVITIGGLTGQLNPSTSGDQFLAYQGTAGSPSFVFAVDFADGNATFAGDATNANTSAVPTGLTFGSTALAFGTDNGAYSGPTSGTAAELKAAIANPANWTLSDASGVAPVGGFTITGLATTVSIGDVTVVEGDAGETLMTFTVTRSNVASDFTVDFATGGGTATAGEDYLAAQGTLTFAAGGPSSQTVTVRVQGDTAIEATETLQVTLSNLQSAGAVTIGDGVATGTIRNDDFTFRRIFEIQGEGHLSAYDGQGVKTEGVVTAVDSNGFWIQDATGDGNDATSDGVFVFTSAAPGVAVGDLVSVAGIVDEFRAGAATNLTMTEITDAVVAKIGTGTVTATVLGEGGREAPTELIDNDNLGTYDPEQDAIDFYESLEGMLVVVPDAQAVAVSDGGATWVVANGGDGATGMSDRGGVTIADGDMNPERIQVFVDSGVLPGVASGYDMGDQLGHVTGVVSYYGGNYEVVATSIETPAGAGAPADDVSALVGDATHLTMAAYNLHNLNAGDTAAKFQGLAHDIITNLRSPDIIGVEEIQDADGGGSGSNMSGLPSVQKLIDAIAAAGGPTYVYVEIAPAPGTSGGANNANIRNGFLYNPERVDYVDGSARLVDPDNSAFFGSRKPLAADFEFRGEIITAIDVHSTSRLGSDPGLFGERQPPFAEGEDQRIAQSTAIRDWVADLVAADPERHVAVMGDFNGFQFEESLTLLEQGALFTNLSWKLEADDRYSYVFEGNSQQIDHMLVTADLYENAEFDAVHLNTGKGGTQPTDHDPVLGRFLINTGPTAVADAAAVDEDAQVVIDVLANDTDPNSGETKTLVSVATSAKGATVTIEDGKVVYTADPDAFDLLTTGETATDSFTYVMKDAAGATSTSTVTVTVKGVADGAAQDGGNGADLVTGTAADEALAGGNGADTLAGLGGADALAGGNGADLLSGGAGIDRLQGGNGADTLDGGAGDDVLTGDNGGDRFVFEGAFGDDLVTDFGNGDRIQLDDVQFADFAAVLGKAAQVGDDVVITLDAANSLTLADVQLASLKASDFLFA